MKKIPLILIFFSFISLSSKDHITVNREIERVMQHGANEGKEFFVAFPYNDSKNHPTQNLAIYVTSRYDTYATVFNSKTNLYSTKAIKANTITEFSTIKGGLGWDFEIYEFEKEIRNGVGIISKDPIKVYVLNSKAVSSEGYMAVPVRKWGTEYIHNSSYDFDEVREWAGGFVVLAREDGTVVNIKIRDGASLVRGTGETTGGKQHGDSISVVLLRGEVFAVQGTAYTRGVFDLSGSHISSNKPIGLISYHNRTMLPATVVTTGRDYLIEMMPPLSSWGTEYHSIELDRGTNKGDLFRVVAGQDNVKFTIKWYDKYTKEKIAQIGPVTLDEKGDWFEYNGTGYNFPHSSESIRGVAHFKADGPILVTQYSYSSNYDGTEGNFDPFMILLPSVEQYSKECIFGTPEDYGRNIFEDNFVSIIAKGDPLDSLNNYNLLSSIRFDDSRVIAIKPEIEKNNIPNTDYYWVILDKVNSGAHKIIADTDFGTTIYGYAMFDSYGWPASQNAEDLVSIDTVSPKVELIERGYKYIFKVDDRLLKIDGPSEESKYEYSVGLNSLPKLKDESENFKEPLLVNENGQELEMPEVFEEQYYYFSVEVDYIGQDAMAVLQVLDKNYNETELTIDYRMISSVEENYKSNIKILNPQPINENTLLLEIPYYSSLTIAISDIEGKILRTLEANGSLISIDVSNLSSGAYFINISDGKTQVTNKFMIER